MNSLVGLGVLALKAYEAFLYIFLDGVIGLLFVK